MQPSINYTFEGSNDNKFMGKAHYVVPEREYLSKSPYLTKGAMRLVAFSIGFVALFLLLGNAAEIGFKHQDADQIEAVNCNGNDCYGLE